MRKRILNQPIDIFTFEEALYFAQMAFINSRQLKIITLNSEMLVNTLTNFEFQAAINNANLIVPDSIGIVWAMKFLNPGLYEDLKRIPGIELAEKILSLANEFSKKLAIYGGREEVLQKAVNTLKSKYPNIQVVIAVDGYQNEEDSAMVAQEISKYSPDLLLVALGTPKQEIWINKFSKFFPSTVMIGIGGSLDIWSGKKSRAPEWLRNAHLEWLFRLLIDPQRIPRVLNSLPKFIWMVLKEKLYTKRHTQSLE